MNWRNPYDTHSWEMDPQEGLRRIDDQNLVNRKKVAGYVGQSLRHESFEKRLVDRRAIVSRCQTRTTTSPR